MTQDFGTSRWPLSNKITLVPLRAEGARCVFAAEAKPPNTSPDVRSRGKRGTVVLILTFHLLTPKRTSASFEANIAHQFLLALLSLRALIVWAIPEGYSKSAAGGGR